MSVTTTELAVEGPPFVSCTVYVTFWPARTGSGAAPFVSARSADGFETVTDTVAKLFVELGSTGLVACTRALLLITVPFAVPAATFATSVTVAEAPEASEPNETVRLLPDPPHVPPPVELQET